MQQTNSIVVFDGVCNLCNGTVNFLIKHDKSRRFHYTTLQSKTGKELLFNYKIPRETDSVILLSDNKVYIESEAALEIARLLPYPWKMVLVFKLIPVKLRDKLYRKVAANRFKWFGKRNTCRIPTAEEKMFFL